MSGWDKKVAEHIQCMKDGKVISHVFETDITCCFWQQDSTYYNFYRSSTENVLETVNTNEVRDVLGVWSVSFPEVTIISKDELALILLEYGQKL